MSTMKADSRAGVRFFRRTGATPPGFHIQRLLEAQRGRMIVIIVGVPAKEPVTRLFIAGDRPGVVLADFEPHRAAAPATRIVLGSRQKQRSDAALADMGGDRDRV